MREHRQPAALQVREQVHETEAPAQQEDEHRDDGGSPTRGKAQCGEVQHRRERTEAGILCRREHRPPEDRARHQEGQVLGDVHAAVGERRVVQNGDVPHRHRPDPQPPRRRRGPKRRHRAAYPGNRSHPLHQRYGNPEEQQRWDDQDEQQMLDHVGAEEIGVPQGVEGRAQGQEQDGDPREKGGRPARRPRARDGEIAGREDETPQRDRRLPCPRRPNELPGGHVTTDQR